MPEGLNNLHCKADQNSCLEHMMNMSRKIASSIS